MPSFGSTSRQRLTGVHPDLISILEDVVETYDITIPRNGGAREMRDQITLVNQGKSKTLNSKHLIQEDGYAHAVDPIPYPVDWDDTARFYFMAGLIFMAAEKRGIKIRWGGDWNMNMKFDDQSFHDLPHIELVT